MKCKPYPLLETAWKAAKNLSCSEIERGGGLKIWRGSEEHAYSWLLLPGGVFWGVQPWVTSHNQEGSANWNSKEGILDEGNKMLVDVSVNYASWVVFAKLSLIGIGENETMNHLTIPFLLVAFKSQQMIGLSFKG